MKENFSETVDMEKEYTHGPINRHILERFTWTRKKATEHLLSQTLINLRYVTFN